MKTLFFIIVFSLCAESWAGVFKCTDAAGNIDYQSSPCAETDQAIRMNPKTGGSQDLDALQRQQQQEQTLKSEQEQQAQAEKQAALDKIAERKKQTFAEHEQTKLLISRHPDLFSAYAIPPYEPDNLPEAIKAFESRLPEIEKLRRLAAQKALSGNQCQRVEADELNARSALNDLVFLVNCSSGQSFYFTETDLTKP